MIVSGRRHLVHHARFYVALAAGIGTWVLAGALNSPVSIAAGGNAFYGIYLVSTAIFAFPASAEDLRRRATYEDEGIILIAVITLGATVLSLWSIFVLINSGDEHSVAELAMAITCVPLGWLTLHTIAAYHYAHLYYARVKTDGKAGDASGLDFPATKEPNAWDFLYHSFVVGMTAQVSDVRVLTTGMRRLTTAHAIVSFFYNTVLLALVVNLVAAQAR